MGNYDKMPYGEHLCEIIFNLGQQLENMLFKEFSIFSSGDLLVSRAKLFGNFDKGPYKEHLCEIIYDNSAYWKNIFFISQPNETVL